MTAAKTPKKKPAPKKATPAKRGRPSKYTPELVEEICERISKGEPLRQICRDEHMPHWTAVYDWMRKQESFAIRIADARELGEEAIAQECLEIANSPLMGEETTIKDNGGIETKRSDMLGHRKLQIETRLKLLAKWNPKKWGDRQHVEHSGKLGLESLIAGD
jgi:hypothetical protein